MKYINQTIESERTRLLALSMNLLAATASAGARPTSHLGLTSVMCCEATLQSQDWGSWLITSEFRADRVHGSLRRFRQISGSILNTAFERTYFQKASQRGTAGSTSTLPAIFLY